MADWREPSAWEHSLLSAILSADFEGNAQYRDQLQVIMVRECDAENQLEITVPRARVIDTSARVKRDALAEAAFLDTDGVPASFILHEKDGAIWFLEKFKADSSPIINKMPTVSQLTIRAI